MSVDYRAHEPSNVGVTNANYRTDVQEDSNTDEKVRFPMSTSSSSSSPSGAATPVDDITPDSAPFPRVATQVAHGMRSSGSSVFSLEQQRSSSKAALPFIPRPPKLSLDTSKVRPIPALPSASTESPLGAFCPTSSAESHLRYLVKHSVADSSLVRPSSRTSRHSSSSTVSSRELSDAKLPFKASPSFRRVRVSSLRSLGFSWSSANNEGHGQPSPYDVDDDSGDEHEAQETIWPRRKHKQAMYKKVPSITRSPSPPSDDSYVGAPTPSSALISRSLVPSSQSSQLRTRAGSISTVSPSPLSLLSTQPRKPSLVMATSHRPTMHVRSSTTSLLPPSPSRSTNSSSVTGNSGSKRSSGLNPALAAAENASRLRSQCVCGVCGKVGSDYPRCPRCSATWCSRQCRISEAGGGKHACRR